MAGEHRRKPSLAHEQVAILYDARSSTEHFLREIAFHDATVPFGFVVPTPSRPEVAKVARSPFETLRRAFAFALPQARGAPARASGDGTAKGFGSGGRPVDVLEQVKVGSFTAFVLAAEDERAMADWLKKNGLTTTPETEAWLGHYVRSKFFFVAMRYDPPADAGGKPRESKDASRKAARSETIRISFSTPAPYYPYLEPQPPAGLPTADRLLDLWLVTNEPSSPVALALEGTKPSWVRPLQPGLVHADARAGVQAVLGSEAATLLPEGSLTVQTFQDQKFSRAGFGDILFAPMERRALEGPRREALGRLAGALDPSLIPARNPTEKARP